jgi:hypothetical protein
VKTTFILQGVPRGAAVYILEGLDWTKAVTVEKSVEPITAEFAPARWALPLGGNVNGVILTVHLESPVGRG